MSAIDSVLSFDCITNPGDCGPCEGPNLHPDGVCELHIAEITATEIREVWQKRKDECKQAYYWNSTLLCNTNPKKGFKIVKDDSKPPITIDFNEEELRIAERDWNYTHPKRRRRTRFPGQYFFDYESNDYY